MKRRVVITGLGAVTPIGNTVEEFWNGVRKGACGIGTITKFDTAEYKVHLAGEVKGFVAKERMDFKAARRMGTFSQYAVAAAKEAFADAGISMENEDPFRVGVLVGSGVGDLNACEQAKAKIDAGNPSRFPMPNRRRMIICSRFVSLLMAFPRSAISTSSSRRLEITSSSVPRISESSSSFPSQSTFSGSSMETSIFVLLFLLRYIRISFSIHRDA